MSGDAGEDCACLQGLTEVCVAYGRFFSFFGSKALKSLFARKGNILRYSLSGQLDWPKWSQVPGRVFL